MSGPDRTAEIPLWRDRLFRRFWAGQSVSQFGDRITELALPLIAVAALNASPNEVAWLTALSWTPNLLAILLGAWVDQQARKRRLMILADLIRAAVLLSIPVAYLLGAVTLGQLYAVALLTGAAGVLFNTAYPPFFVRLVPRTSYVDANSKLSTSRSVSYVAGPAIGGALVQALTAPVTLVVDALTFLVSAVLIGQISVDEPPGSSAGAAAPSLLRRARAGLLFIIRHPVLRAGLGCAATVNFFTFVAGSGLIVLFASRSLGLSAGAIGIAFGIGATGALLGAVLPPHAGAGRPARDQHQRAREVRLLPRLPGRTEVSRMSPRYLDARYVLDRLVAAVLLVILSPVMAVVALAVLSSSGRPILFRQHRVGRHGETFSVLKFRTMVENAERIGGGYTPEGTGLHHADRQAAAGVEPGRAASARQRAPR